MTDVFYPAVSSFEMMAGDEPVVTSRPYRHGVSAVDDNVELRVAPSGLSVRGRYWREGRYLKAVVHVQAAGVSPKTISAQVDLQPIAVALKRRLRERTKSGVRVGGWPGSFIKAVSKIGKSKLIGDVTNAVKDVAKSKLTGAVVGAAAVVFPPVGVPAAAAYATANAAIATIDHANEVKNRARALLSRGTAQQKAALGAKASEIREALSRAATVKQKLREVAQRAQRGDLAAKKTARIFSHVMAHRRRVQEHGVKLDGKQMMPGLLVTDLGRIIPGKWLFAAAAAQGAPVLSAAAGRGTPLLAAPAGKRLLLGPPASPRPARPTRKAVMKRRHR